MSRRRSVFACIAILVVILQFANFSYSQTVPEGFDIVNINTFLDSDADGFALLPDEQRIFVIHQFSGEVKLIVNGTLKSQPLLTVPNLKTSSEKGLLGIAIDPDFPDQPYIYLFHSHSSNTNRVSKFTVSGDLQDPNSDNLSINVNSQQVLIDDMPANAFNHNGGTLRFASDKTLFISHGDDANRSQVQNLTTLNGKILRINRDGSIPANNPTFPNEPPDKRPEIFAFGFRNPFRFQIDSKNDTLFIGDVGENSFEEFDLSGGGENFGWPRYEGNSTFDSNANLIAPAPTFPIFDYPHTGGGPYACIALIVYRQQDFPHDFSFPNEFEGTYFYADFYHTWLRNLRPDGQGGWESVDFGTGWTQPVDAALGSDGGFYILEYGKALRKIVNANPVPVELSLFEARLFGDKVVLNWRTESEMNNFGFEVQRSLDKETFQKIGFVKGHGSTAEPKMYTFEDRELLTGTLFYRLKQIDVDGRFEWSGIVSVAVTPPAQFELKQNYPNPFNPATEISFKLPQVSRGRAQASRAVLTIYDIRGRTVKTLLDQDLLPGTYSRTWDGTNREGEPVANGLYIYRLTYGEFSQARKMIFAK